jgi:hypothetical protein
MLNHKFHFVYKTTNLVNGKEYIGKRSTNKLEDGYLGSGKLLKKAIKKYGRENFIREIISFHNSAEEALKAERLIVNEEYIKNKKTYNLIIGGKGGGVKGRKQPKSFCIAHSIFMKALGDKHPMKNIETVKKVINTTKKNNNYRKHKFITNIFEIEFPIYDKRTRKRTEEEKLKTSKRMQGENHPLYGKKGINSPNYGKKRTDEFKKQQSIRFSGDYNPAKNPSVKTKMSIAAKNRPNKICPYCLSSNDQRNAAKNHFNNCKYNPILFNRWIPGSTAKKLFQTFNTTIFQQDL